MSQPKVDKATAANEYYHIYQNASPNTDNPYWRVGGNTAFDSVRRFMAPINPFRLRQVPSHKRDAFVPRHGITSFQPDQLPNPVIFQFIQPGHYDPLNKANPGTAVQTKMGEAPIEAHKLVKIHEPIPMGCARARQRWDRCTLVNGTGHAGKSGPCEEEARGVLEICPRWVLQHFKKTKLKTEYMKAVQIQEFEEAMKVSEYNKGRSIKDVDLTKSWKDGTRENLRPDSLWADDRYHDVTAEEIKAAKERHRKWVEENEKAHPKVHKDEHGHGHGHGHGHH